MEQKNNLTKANNGGLLAKRMLAGAAISLALIITFLYSADGAEPEWGRYWMIRPLIIVPLAGAAGGLFYHLLSPWRSRGGWKAAAAIVLSVIVYVFGLWIGTVLGLDGTYWN